MRRRFFILCFLSCILLSAQNRRLDSLWQDYKKPAAQDTSRIKTLNFISYSYSQINADTGRIIALQVIKQAQQGHYKKLEAAAYNNLGVNYMNLDSSDKAIKAFDLCYTISETLNDKNKMAAALINIGLVHDNLSNYFTSLEYKQKALKIYEETKDKKGLANVYANLGNTYKHINQTRLAINCYIKSLKMAEELADKSLQANNLNNIGLVYLSLHEDQRALNYFEKSVKLKEEIGNKRGLCISLTNASHALLQLKRYKESLDIILKAYEVQKQMGSLSGIANSLQTLGFYYYNLPEKESAKLNLTKEEKFKKAIDYHMQSLKISEEIGEKRISCINFSDIGSAYFAINNFKEAEKFLNRALKLIKETGALDEEANVQESLSETYDKLGNKSMALAALKRSMFLRDSLQNQNLRDEIARTEIQYEYNKRAAADSIKNAEAQKVKDTEIKLQGSQLKQERTQRFALYGGLGLILCFAIFAYSRFKITQKQKSIIELQKYEVEKQKALVEEKQKEVMDSIRYAKRIQTSLLPSEKYIARNLKKKE